MSLMEILMVLPFDDAAIIHRQHAEGPLNVHAPISNPRMVESGWSLCGVDGCWLPQQTIDVGGYHHRHC